MPQLANIILTDRATTPVNHTFVPRDIVDGVGTVVEPGSVPMADKPFSVSLRKTAQGRYKAIIKLTLPVVQTQTLNGIDTPVIVRTAYVEASFSFDAASTEQERKDAVGMFQSSLDATKTLVNDTVVKLQGVY